jgi:hypothetical protein
VKKPVSKFAFQMQPAALQRDKMTAKAKQLFFRNKVGRCTLNQVDP